MRWHHWIIVALAVLLGLVFLLWAGKPASAAVLVVAPPTHGGADRAP